MTQTRASLRERQAEQVRTSVVDAAIGELESKAIDDVSMGDVAAAAGISLRTLYRYFPDRASLLYAVGDSIYESLGISYEITGPEEVSTSFLDAARRLSTRPALARALVQTSFGRGARSMARRRRVDAVRTAVQPVTEGVDADTARWAAAVIAFLCGAASWVTISDETGLDETDAQQAVAWAIETLLTALRCDPDAPSRGALLR